MKHLLLVLFAVALVATSISAQTTKPQTGKISKALEDAKKLTSPNKRAIATKTPELEAKRAAELKKAAEEIAKKEAEAKAKKEAESKASKKVVTPAKPGATSPSEALKKLEAAKKPTTVKPPVKK